MKRTLILLALGCSLAAAACDRFIYVPVDPPALTDTPAPTQTTAPTQTPTITFTPDPCSTENLTGEVGRVNDLMREFDDYSALASNTPQSQLVILVPQLQRIQREAEDQEVPACLVDLKKLQLAHMNIVVETLMAFMNSTDVSVINAGIGQAHDLHNRYMVEMARLLGVTITVLPTSTAGIAVPESNLTPSALPAPVVTNQGLYAVILQSAPDLAAPETGQLAAQAHAIALGKSPDQVWIKVEIPGQPGQTAWVFAALVRLSVPITDLPIVQ